MSRTEAVRLINDLTDKISNVIGYSSKNLLLEVSKVTKMQLDNDSVVPNFGLYRVLIFKYLTKYCDLAERKSRILTPILIDLYK